MEEENWIVIGNVYDDASRKYCDVEARIDEDDESPQLYLRFKLPIEEQYITVEKCVWITEPTFLKLWCARFEERTRKLNEEVVKDANRNRKNKSSTV